LLIVYSIVLFYDDKIKKLVINLTIIYSIYSIMEEIQITSEGIPNRKVLYEIGYKDYNIFIRDMIYDREEGNSFTVQISPCTMDMGFHFYNFFKSKLSNIHYEKINKVDVFKEYIFSECKSFVLMLRKSRNVYYQYNLEPEEKITSLIGSIKYILDKSRTTPL